MQSKQFWRRPYMEKHKCSPQYKSSRLSLFCVVLTYFDFDIRQEHSPLALCRRCPSPVFMQFKSVFYCWKGHILNIFNKRKVGNDISRYSSPCRSWSRARPSLRAGGHRHRLPPGCGRIHYVSHQKYE